LKHALFLLPALLDFDVCGSDGSLNARHSALNFTQRAAVYAAKKHPVNARIRPVERHPLHSSRVAFQVIHT
jgi:hypothetical protein